MNALLVHKKISFEVFNFVDSLELLQPHNQSKGNRLSDKAYIDFNYSIQYFINVILPT